MPDVDGNTEATDTVDALDRLPLSDAVKVLEESLSAALLNKSINNMLHKICIYRHSPSF